MMTRLGIYSLLTGLFVGIFSGISRFMGTQNLWIDLTISKIIGKDYSEAFIGLINVAVVKTSLNFLIYELPFFIFLLGLGVIFLVISMFVKNP